MATPAHMSILPPQERHSQQACVEHQCPIWLGDIMVSGKTQVHSTAGASNLVHTVPKPSGTMDHEGWSSSNMQLFSTNSAITSRQSRTGLLQTRQYAVASNWEAFKTAALNPSDPHWVLAGSLLHSLVPAELAVIAEGSLMNKVFPSKKEYQNQMRLGMQSWT